MATCKDCFCQYMCHEFSVYGMGENDITGEYFEDMERRCENFKDKSKIKEFPCDVGDIVWFIRKNNGKPEPIETVVEKIIEKESGLFLKLACNSMHETSCRSIGKTVFFSKKEMEKALKELENG